MDRKENAKLIKGFIGTFFFYTGLLSIEYDGMRCCLLDFLESLPYNGISLGFCKTQLTGIRECIKDQDSTLVFLLVEGGADGRSVLRVERDGGGLPGSAGDGAG